MPFDHCYLNDAVTDILITERRARGDVARLLVELSNGIDHGQDVFSVYAFAGRSWQRILQRLIRKDARAANINALKHDSVYHGIGVGR